MNLKADRLDVDLHEIGAGGEIPGALSVPGTAANNNSAAHAEVIQGILPHGVGVASVKACHDADSATTTPRLNNGSSSSEVAAFEILFRTYRRPLVAHAANVTHSKPDGEEVAQEALLGAWLNRHRIKSGSEKKWLYTSTLHTAIDILRGRRVHVDFEVVADLPQARILAGASHMGDPVSTLAHMETLRELGEALARLPSRQRTALELRIEGSSYESISRKMKLSLGGVKSLLVRARGEIEEAMDESQRETYDKKIKSREASRNRLAEQQVL